jgi:hypothetical protein
MTYSTVEDDATHHGSLVLCSDLEQVSALSDEYLVCPRWTAAGMLEAEREFRRVIGHPDLAKLAVAVERDVTTRRLDHTTTGEPNTLVTA